MQHQHAHAPRFELNGIRIAGTSAAIALHLVILMLLMVPTQWLPPKADPPVYNPIPVVEIVPPPPIPIATVTPPIPHIPKPANTAPSKPDPRPQQIATTDEVSPEVGVPENTDVTMGPTGFQEPVMAELSADVAPAPPYPAVALREGMAGKVMLRITVDAEGHPIDGRIEKSSGSRLLDQTALKFVLARWHFNPAVESGLPVVSIALVPIVFTLDQ